jgi:hypothetical protein
VAPPPPPPPPPGGGPGGGGPGGGGPGDFPCTSCSGEGTFEGPGKNHNANHSADLEFTIGKTLHSPARSAGKLFIRAKSTSPSLATPASLKYTMMKARVVDTVEKDGDTLVIVSFTADNLEKGRMNIKFSLSSNGEPENLRFNKLRLLALDENGNEVQENPYYYDVLFSNGRRFRMLASSGEYYADVMKSGRIFKMSDSGVDVIRNADLTLRQINAPQTLADIVTVNDFKYEIRYYLPGQVGEKDAEGIYQITGDPFVRYVIENPEASTENYDKLKCTTDRKK